MMKELASAVRKSLLKQACLAASLLLFMSGSASALSGSSFMAGRIIDDFLFYNSGTMSINSIQSFLNGKVPVCDTNGTQPSEFGGPDTNHDGTVTRAEYGTSVGHPPPYTCLKNYSTTIPGMAADAYCGAITSSGSTKKSAAEIIYRVANACHISPKVLIVTLQKESAGPLVTDTWPFPTQYNYPMGFACPDSSGCSSTYKGFFKQMYYAARQFQKYRQVPDQFNYVAGTNNRILWNPSTSCGSSVVYISTQATAGLYNYTPYRPNAAALNNLYGSGDSCSSYGNRNFWRFYNDWFGSTLVNAIKLTYVDGHSSESGGTAVVEYSLISQPTANVTIPLALNNAAEASFSNSSSVTSSTITITPANWNVPANNRVTVYGRDDNLPDGDVGYTLIAGKPSSSDTTYGSLDSAAAPNANLVNDDNEPDTALAGDWNGDGRTDVGLKRGNHYLLNYGFDGHPEVDFSYGRFEDTLVTGDWNGDHKTDVGVRRGKIFYLNYNHDSRGDVSFSFGRSDDIPIAGDWNGDGKWTVGLYRPSTRQFFLSNSNNGHVDAAFGYGSVGDTPLAGDWNGNRKWSVGVYRPSTNQFFLTDRNAPGRANITVHYGQPGDKPLVGDWDKDRQTEPGIRRGKILYLNYNFDGYADVSFSYGR